MPPAHAILTRFNKKNALLRHSLFPLFITILNQILLLHTHNSNRFFFSISLKSQNSSTMSSKNGVVRSCLGSMDDIKKVFQRFDKNGDGKISVDELKEVIRALSPTASPEETVTMMKQFDLDGNGFIDLDEFVALFQIGIGGGGNNRSGLKEAFELYDLDGNGRISAKELHSVMKNLGEKCSVQDCKKMISKVDIDGDGCVNFDEFKKMMSNGGGA